MSTLQNWKICKYILTALIVIIFVGSLNAQDGEKEDNDNKEEKSIRDKLFFGGSFSFQFGSVTYIDLNPVIGYRFIPSVSIGVGGIYQYINSKSELLNNFETSIYGGNAFVRYFVIQNLHELLNVKVYGSIYLHGEYEALNLDSRYYGLNLTAEADRFWLQSFLVGAGYAQKISKYGYVYIELLWNLNHSDRSPYSNPLFQIGFTF